MPVRREVPPVSCTDTPYGRQVVVTCRYYWEGQKLEAWEKALERGSVAALSVGLTHVQFLSVELRPETVRELRPLRCESKWGGYTECTGGNPIDRPVSWLAINQFALLTADEAAARSSDPLVPEERRPFDAHAYLAASPATSAPRERRR